MRDMALSDDILTYALTLGFDRAGIIPLGPPKYGAAFADWLAAGYYGDMAYLAARAAERLDPRAWLGDAASLILLAANYNPGPPPATWADPAHGRFARYAWAADYHDVIKARLHALDAFMRARTGRTALGKACVDTAPLLERDFAAQAGLGFSGRNTCLITPGLGSWTFLAALAVPERLDEGRTTNDERRMTNAPSPFVLRPSSFVGCGRCTRCLDACPTHAFVAPHVLDARRCISYLTIELRGPIPRELRPAVGNWVFGCDVCQEVCPYNQAAQARHVPGTSQVPGTFPLLDLLALDEWAFRAHFRGTAIVRTKRRGLVRNACVAAGNWGDPAAVPALIARLADPEPLIRGHAAWALGQIGGRDALQALAARAVVEDDAWVRAEIAAAL
jgi:epoxyqueuosine reductase